MDTITHDATKTVAAYTHPAPASTQAPDPEPGNYYVSVKDGARVGLLLGPFRQHALAIAWVEPCRQHACEVNAWAHFCGFGTLRMADDYEKPGLFNAALLLVADDEPAGAEREQGHEDVHTQ